MKGLARIPSIQEVATAYERFQNPKRLPISAAEFALWSQWSRFDPRLAEQWISAILARWRSLSPVLFNEALIDQPWPAAAAVLLEQAKAIGGWRDRAEKKLFTLWMGCAVAGIQPAANELFFIGLRSFAGRAMAEDAVKALRPYRIWGYLGREVLLNKEAATPTGATWVSKSSRHEAISMLLKAHRRFTVEDYIKALDGKISRRQAQLDLKKDPRIRASGNTRGRAYQRGSRK